MKKQQIRKLQEITNRPPKSILEEYGEPEKGVCVSDDELLDLDVLILDSEDSGVYGEWEIKFVR